MYVEIFEASQSGWLRQPGKSQQRASPVASVIAVRVGRVSGRRRECEHGGTHSYPFAKAFWSIEGLDLYGLG